MTSCLSICGENKNSCSLINYTIQPIQANKRKLLAAGLLLTAGLASFVFFQDHLWRLLLILSERETVTEVVQGKGWLGPAIFSLVQLLQVILPFIPGAPVFSAAGYIYGFSDGLQTNLASLTLAALLTFRLARLTRGSLVRYFVPAGELSKWPEKFEQRSFLYLTLLFMVPFLPTDAFNFVAGINYISQRRFLGAFFLGRLSAKLLMTLVGSHGLDSPGWLWDSASGWVRSIIV